MSDYWYMQHGEGEFERGRRPRFDHHVAQHLQPGFVDMTYYVQVGWGESVHVRALRALVCVMAVAGQPSLAL